MSTASDFQITALSPEDVAYYARQREQGLLMCSASLPRNSCLEPGCLEPVLFEASYSYISGAKGRRTISRRQLCRKHAMKFCERYQLALPALPAGVQP